MMFYIIGNNDKSNYLYRTQLLMAVGMLLALQCGHSDAMLKKSMSKTKSLRSSSFNRSESLRSTSGAMTRLERAAEQYGLTAADFCMFKYEARLDTQINALSKEIHLCENTMIAPDLLTRTHQLAKNALVVSIAFDDVLNNIYPEVEADLKQVRQELEATNRYKQEYMDHMTNFNRSPVPYEQRNEYNAKTTEYTIKLKSLETKKAYYKRCIEEMRSDYRLIEDAAMRGLTIVDIQQRAESIKKPSLYQEKFASFLKERRKSYAQKAETLVRRFKEVQEPVSELRAIEPFASKPPLGRPPLPPSLGGASPSIKWGNSSMEETGATSSASVNKQSINDGKGSNGKRKWVPPNNVKTAEVRPDGALQYKLTNGDTWEIVVGEIWHQESNGNSREIGAEYAPITENYYNELKARI